MTMQVDAPPRVRATYGYYRQPDGFITVSPATDTDELRYRRGGWEPLRQYGTFEMATPYMASHPLEPLFMAGGAHELTEEQIRQQGLHLNPILVPSCRTPLSQEHKRHTRACLANQRPVVFPQLERMTDLGPFPCQMPGCARPPFPTRAARDQHEGVMHKPEKSDERTGESLAAALIQGLGGQAPTAPVAVSAPIAAVPVAVSDPALAAVMAELAELRAELEATKRRKTGVGGKANGTGDGSPATVKSSNRNQTPHTHDRPFGVRYLVAGCPRCEELRQQA